MAAFNVVLGCVMFLLILLYTISHVARYYIKFTSFILLSLIYASAPIPLMLLKPRDARNGLIPAYLLRHTAKLLGIEWEVRGTSNIDNSRGNVVLLNHQSGIDLFMLAVLWPLMDRCTVVSKRALLYLVPFGTACWLWGTVFIDRASGNAARASVNKEAEAVKNRKAKLLLFPEGTRHGGDKLLPFRKGAFHAALDASAPVQPVVVSKYHFLDSKRKIFGSGKVILTILPLIETDGLTKADIPLLLEKTQALMQDVFTTTSNETLVDSDSKKKS